MQVLIFEEVEMDGVCGMHRTVVLVGKLEGK